MACLLNTNITRTCAFSLAGLSDLWIANKSEVSGITSSAITMSGSAKFYKMEFERNSANFINQLQVNGTVKSVKQSIGWQTNVEGQSYSTTAALLALGTFVAIGKTNATGKKFVLGRTGFGLEATVVSLNSGQNETDTTGGIIVNLEGAGVEYALEYTGTDASIPV